MWLRSPLLTTVLAAFLLAQSANAAGKFTCPKGSVPAIDTDQGLCYSFLSAPAAYLDAEQTCVDLGGHLVSIEDSFTDTFVNQNAAKAFKLVNSSDFWIGANDLASSGVWTWTDGKPLTFTDWASGQPGPSPGADCAAIILAGGLWDAADCYARKPYVCAVQGTPVKSCPLACPSEWTFFAQTGSCYRVSFNKKWDDAEAECVSQGAHLASLHSEAEDVFVANLAHTTLKSSTPHQCWIGGYTHDKNKNWAWTDGSPYDYSRWAHKQPDHAGKENCVQIFSDESEWLAEESWYQKWNNYDCNEKVRAFVCKKPAIQV